MSVSVSLSQSRQSQCLPSGSPSLPISPPNVDSPTASSSCGRRAACAGVSALLQPAWIWCAITTTLHLLVCVRVRVWVLHAQNTPYVSCLYYILLLLLCVSQCVCVCVCVLCEYLVLSCTCSCLCICEISSVTLSITCHWKYTTNMCSNTVLRNIYYINWKKNPQTFNV